MESILFQAVTLAVLMTVIIIFFDPIASTVEHLFNGDYPVFCVSCGKMMWHSNAKEEQALTGDRLFLCDDCHRDYFQPFKERNDL